MKEEVYSSKAACPNEEYSYNIISNSAILRIVFLRKLSRNELSTTYKMEYIEMKTSFFTTLLFFLFTLTVIYGVYELHMYKSELKQKAQPEMHEITKSETDRNNLPKSPREIIDMAENKGSFRLENVEQMNSMMESNSEGERMEIVERMQRLMREGTVQMPKPHPSEIKDSNLIVDAKDLEDQEVVYLNR